MATKYLYGGSANWNDGVTHWSLNSGNSPSSTTTTPTASDDVIVDGNSGTGTLTVNVTSVCKTATFSTTNITLAGSSQLTVSGNLTFYAGMTSNYSGMLTFNTTATLLTNGVALKNDVYANNGNYTLTIGDNLTTNDVGGHLISTTGAGAVILNLNVANRTITGYGLNWGTSSGSSTLTLTNSTWVMATGAYASNNGDWAARVGGGSVTFVGSNSCDISFARHFYGEGGTYHNVVALATSAANRIVGGQYTTTVCTFNNLTLDSSGYTSGITNWNLGSNLTISGTLRVNGYSALYPAVFKSQSAGTQRTVTVNAFDAASNNIQFKDIVIAGAASPITANAISDAGNNSGITFTNNRYWVNGTGNWSQSGGNHWAKTSGGTADQITPNLNDAVIFDSNSFTAGSQTSTNDNTSGFMKSLTINGCTNAGKITWNANTGLYGNLSSDNTATFNNSTGFHCDPQPGITTNITSGGMTWGFGLRCSGNLTMNDALTLGAELVCFANSATVTTNNYALQATYLSTNSNNISWTLALGSSVVTLTGVTGFDSGTGTLTLTGTSTIKLTAGGATLNYKAGQVFYNVERVNAGNTMAFTTPVTFNSLTLTTTGTATNTFVYQFTAGATTTITSCS